MFLYANDIANPTIWILQFQHIRTVHSQNLRVNKIEKNLTLHFLKHNFLRKRKYTTTKTITPYSDVYRNQGEAQTERVDFHDGRCV